MCLCMCVRKREADREKGLKREYKPNLFLQFPSLNLWCCYHSLTVVLLLVVGLDQSASLSVWAELSQEDSKEFDTLHLQQLQSDIFGRVRLDVDDVEL